MTPDGPDVWVFGYGSLVWKPEFDHTARVRARLDGYHRALCVFSLVHRGTPGRPGLVFGLDRGGACEGVAYRVARSDFDRVHRYLRARELTTGVYRERFHTVDLHLADVAGCDGDIPDRVRALCYVADRSHCQYAGWLNDNQRAELVRQANGLSGANLDYVVNTMRSLKKARVRDKGLERFAARLGASRLERCVGPADVLETRSRYRVGQRPFGVGPELVMLRRRRQRPYCGHYRKLLGL